MEKDGTSLFLQGAGLVSPYHHHPPSVFSIKEGQVNRGPQQSNSQATMNFLLVLLLLVATAVSLPLEGRTRRQAYYPQNNWGYNPSYNRGYNRGLWRYGGVGGPNGEGSTWEGGESSFGSKLRNSDILASAFGVSNNDISIFGAFYKK